MGMAVLGVQFQGLFQLCLSLRPPSGPAVESPQLAMRPAMVRADSDGSFELCRGLNEFALVLVTFLKKWAALLKRPAVLLKRPGRLVKRPACAYGTGGGF